MSRKMHWVVTPFLMLFCLQVAFAHHSSVSTYDFDQEILHRNVTILKWQFINPHPQIIYELQDDEGNVVTWSAGTENVQSMRRNGYSKDSFKPGQVLTLKGNPGRGGKHVLWIRGVTLPDGTEFNFDEAAPAALHTVAETTEAEGNKNGSQDHLAGVWVWIEGALAPEDRAKAPTDAVFVDAYGQVSEELAIGKLSHYPLTEKGRAIQAAWTKESDECRPFSPWHSLTAPFAVEITKPHAERIHIWYEFLDLERTVWLDGREHPSTNLIPPSLQGHSVGHWEGDTLVIETVNMLSNLINRNGIYHSDKAVLTERFSRTGDMLTVVRVLEDSENLTKPITEVVKRKLAPDVELQAYGQCTPQLSGGSEAGNK